MFASRTTAPVTIGDVVVTISKLNWKVLGEAAAAAEPRLEQAAANARRLLAAAGADVIAAIEKRAASAPVDIEAQRQRRYALYDRGVVLKGFTDRDGKAHRGGIVKWTDTEPVTREAIDDLDDDAAEALHRAILDLSLPPIDADARRKND